MSLYTDLIIPPKLADICEMRQSVFAKMQEAYRLLDEADEELRRYHRYCGLPYEAKPRTRLEEARQKIDESLWRSAFDLTGLMQFMDAEAKQRFMREVEQKPPEFTVENVRSTLLSVMQDVDTMFARGLVNVFLRLSKDHKTNTTSPFKVNERAILSGMVKPRWGGGLEISYGHWASERLNDIDRVLKTLDGLKHQPRSLETAINGVFAENNVYEDDYYHVRGYRKGSMHIRFKRLDLLEKANKLISDYYHGQALAVRSGNQE